MKSVPIPVHSQCNIPSATVTQLGLNHFIKYHFFIFFHDARKQDSIMNKNNVQKLLPLCNTMFQFIEFFASWNTPELYYQIFVLVFLVPFTWIRSLKTLAIFSMLGNVNMITGTNNFAFFLKKLWHF